MREQTGGSAEGRHLFFSGVMLLGMANILVKVIGLLFKIPMSYYLGDEGMGYFNSAYQIYTWLYMLSTAGLPVAVSILISQSRARMDYARVQRIFSVTMRTFFLVGVVGTGLMYFGAGSFANMIGAPDARFCIMAISPTLFFICLSSALRGYFQGFQQMGPPAMSQVLEALGKLLIGVAFASWAQGQGYDLPHMAAFSVMGLAVGEAAGTVYLLYARYRYRKKGRLPTCTDTFDARKSGREEGLIRSLLSIAFPVTVSASVMSLTSLIDLVLIQRRLQSLGYTGAEATAFFGNYTTLVVPMFNLPPALIYPIATALTPLLSNLHAAGNRQGSERIVQAVLRITMLIALPCALGLSVFSLPILSLFFRADMAESAAPLLSVLSVAVVFISLLAVTNAILQAYGEAGKPTLSMLAGAGVKLVTNYVLVGVPGIGTAGVPLSTVLCYLTAILLNLFFVIRCTGILPSLGRVLLRPLLSAILSVGAGEGVYVLLGGESAGRLSVIPVILATALFYLAAVFLLRCITREDLMLIPYGDRLCAAWEKRKLSFRQR